MRERHGEDPDEVVRRRLRSVWPQAEPLPPEDVDEWRRRDTDGLSPGTDAWSPGTDAWSPGTGGAAASWGGGTGEPPGPPPGSPSDSPPGRWALGSFDPGRRGVRALAACAVLVVLAAAFFAWRAQPHAEPVPVVGSAPAATLPGTDAVDETRGTATIVVAVTGRVQHPGLVRLPAGARVEDAIEAAGGVLPGTDLSFVNLARKLTDGELIVIGVSPPPGVNLGGAPDGGGTGDGAGGGSGGGGKVNLNTASLAELDSLPGVGPAIAQRILDYRKAHGGFRSIDELRQVEGIGDAKFAQLKDRVTV